MLRHLILPALGAALTLAGCGQPIATPSLALRPVEKQAIDLPASSSIETEGDVTPALRAQTGALVARAEAADKLFLAQRRRTEISVGRASGARQGSDAWVEAQAAITALDALRAPNAEVAAALDALRVEPSNAAPANRAEIDISSARLAKIDEAERSALAALTAQLG